MLFYVQVNVWSKFNNAALYKNLDEFYYSLICYEFEHFTFSSVGVCLKLCLNKTVILVRSLLSEPNTWSLSLFGRVFYLNWQAKTSVKDFQLKYHV